jgi:hypothetical protein
MKITVPEEADSEFATAVAYYDSQEAGLGQRFEDEIDRTVLWLAEHPYVCQLRRGIYRRMNLQIFPYYIPISSVNRLCGLSPSPIRDADRSTGSGEPRV